MYKKRIAAATAAGVIVLTVIKGSIGMEASGNTDIANAAAIANIASIAETAIEETDDRKQDDRLIIPSIEDVKKYGYPKNEAGETYGPDVYEFPSDETPDLMLAVNHEGVVGYVKNSDFYPEVFTIEDALKCNEITRWELNMYLQDGKTCIGTFVSVRE